MPKQERLFCEEGAGMGNRAQALRDNSTVSSIRGTTSGRQAGGLPGEIPAQPALPSWETGTHQPA